METFIVTAEKLLYGGDALARRDDGKAVFIPYAVAGDRLLVQTCAEKKNYIRAEILEILTPGAGRVTPACPHFGKCGGCSWQQIEYPRQVEAKRLILEDIFHHRFPETGRLTITMQPCPRPFGYRSRARVQIQLRITNYELRGYRPRAHIRRHTPRSNVAVGFFRGGSHIVEDMESCPLFRPRLNDALRALRQIPPGYFRTGGNDIIQEIDIAGSEEDGKWAIAKYGDKETLLRRRVGDFTYNIAAGTFFQANDFMVDALVSHVMGCVSQNSGSALDLFSGAGLFSLPLAHRFGAVTAVEYSRESHGLCAMNAAGAGIGNLETVCADAAEWLKLQASSRFDCVVLDPPRAGAGSGVMEQAGRLASREIVYVSCDPQTLVRDLERLDMDCWRIVSVTGFDMFPQTYHFETVVHLER
ncbi:MAG: RsmD family RNA methyltransferase [Acidobacteria bacterium]|nr:RsmD family RNA methyltransferase [Acidobacteriota bacterium]